MRNATPTPSVSSNKLDPIAVLREGLAAAAVCHGVERVEDLTEALVSRVVQRLGGTTVYVRNTRALAREYGVSVRWVQRLLISNTTVRN